MIFGFPQLYMAALYPNQDADISRDHVLHAHIARLSAVVTPSHADLKIPRRYQYECPWPAAQVISICGFPQSYFIFSGGATTSCSFQNAGGQGSMYHSCLHHHHEPSQSGSR